MYPPGFAVYITLDPMNQRKSLPVTTALAVLTEAGYRCAVPTCRTILAIDLHHMVEVGKGGTNDPANLVALCPTCHALYHRGTIKKESWAAAGSVDTDLSFLSFLELYRTDVAQC